MAENGGRQIAVFDFDRTLTRFDTVRLLLLCLGMTGGFRRSLTAMRFWRDRRRPFQERKAAAFGALLRGRSSAVPGIAQALFGCIIRRSIFPAVLQKMNEYRASGATLCIATASPAFAVRAVFPDPTLLVIGIEYAECGGSFTGEPAGPVPYHEAKATALRGALRPEDRLIAAFSDEVSDLPLIQMAEAGFMVDRAGGIVPWP